ncbi:MAG: SGNH/GDSL hydrolase family protein [Chloroflexota bacterium]
MGLRYVALGDSYTIGTSVREDERWPNQLVAALDGALELVANPAVNGYTSADVLRDELPVFARSDPELASLLIGVNDVVQGVPDATYAANVAVILDELLERLPANRIVCLATPDYTLTPRGADYGAPHERRAGITRVNALLAAACRVREITFVPQIFAISGRVAQDPRLVAGDGLHPSGAQYALWTDAIGRVVRGLLS